MSLSNQTQCVLFRSHMPRFKTLNLDALLAILKELKHDSFVGLWKEVEDFPTVDLEE